MIENCLPPRARVPLLLGLVLSAALARAEAGPQNAAEQIPFDAAEVTSSGEESENPSITISWHAPGVSRVVILADRDPDHLQDGERIGEGAGEGSITVGHVATGTRLYFELLPDRGKPLILADRSLHLSTAANFRDVGGYRTEDGKWVRMGLVYRSNELDRLTPAEFETIDKLHLKLICDLRTEEERTRGADQVPPGAADVPADVLADDADKIRSMLAAGKPGGPSEAQITEIYRDFVRLDSARQSYHLLFQRLSEPANLPTVFHCSAGKDRTGWAAAILLTILKVPHQTILEDYALTNRYLQGKARQQITERFPSESQRTLAADPAYIEAAFDEVRNRFGSFDAYLHQGLGLDDDAIEAIRRNLLAG